MIMLTNTMIRKAGKTHSGRRSRVHRLCYIGYMIQIGSKKEYSLLDIWI
jgi:hypothetical protein